MVGIQYVGQCVAEHILRVMHKILQLRQHHIFHGSECFRILSRRGEVQIQKLHHRFQIFRGRFPRNGLFIVTHRNIKLDILTGKQFLQIGKREFRQPGSAYHIGRHYCIRIVLGRIKRRSAGTLGRKQNLVFLEVSRFEKHFHTVGQRQFRIAQSRVHISLHDAAFLWKFRHKRFVHSIVNVCFHISRLDLGNYFLQLLLSRDNHALLLRAHRHHDKILVCNNLFYVSIDLFHRNHRGDSLHLGVCLVDAYNRRIVDEVADITLRIDVVLIRGAVVVFRLKLA